MTCTTGGSARRAMGAPFLATVLVMTLLELIACTSSGDHAKGGATGGTLASGSGGTMSRSGGAPATSGGTMAASGGTTTGGATGTGGADTGGIAGTGGKPSIPDSGPPAPDASTGGMRDAPPEVLLHAEDWPLPNRTYDAARAVTGSSIRASNVATLKQAWEFDLPGTGLSGGAVAPALVLGDVVLYQDMGSNVFSLDFASGSLRWQRIFNRGSIGPNGVAVGYGKVFAATTESSFSALDLATGKDLWTASLPMPGSSGIDIAPVAYGGLVLMSTVPVNPTKIFTGGTTGVLYGLDQSSGHVVWSFDTVTSDRWGDPLTNGGGGAWYPPSIDVDTGVTFWGIGNAEPFLGTFLAPSGTSRPGPNLYSSSSLAVGLRDGRLRWYHQEKPHDLFDLDFQCPPILVSARAGGVDRRLAIASGKTGTVVALDRDTGALVWRATVGIHQNDDLDVIPASGVVVYPGDTGGVETPPAYADGVVYVPVVNWGVKYFPNFNSAERTDGKGEFVALDVADGKVLWKIDLDTPPFGAATVVNDLVFTATLDGKVHALARKDGAEVASFQMPLGVNAPLTVARDTVFVGTGIGTGLGTPRLVALRLP